MRLRTLPLLFISTLGLNFLLSDNIAFSAQDGDTIAIDNYISRQAKRERGEEYKEARKVVVGDLNHDGEPETVVLYTIEGQSGSNLHIQYIAVFMRQQGKLTPLTHADVGGKNARSVELTAVENNVILMTTLSYGPNDPSCCPSVQGTARYELAGKMLREVKRGKSTK